jgi:hypothetical protein
MTSLLLKKRLAAPSIAYERNENRLVTSPDIPSQPPPSEEGVFRSLKTF